MIHFWNGKSLGNVISGTWHDMISGKFFSQKTAASIKNITRKLPQPKEYVDSTGLAEHCAQLVRRLMGGQMGPNQEKLPGTMVSSNPLNILSKAGYFLGVASHLRLATLTLRIGKKHVVCVGRPIHFFGIPPFPPPKKKHSRRTVCQNSLASCVASGSPRSLL